MRITGVETIIVRLPYRQSGPPSGFGGKLWTTMDTLLVRVDTDAGISGWGEAFGYNINEGSKATLDTLIAPLCLGRDPTAIAELMADLQRKLHFFGRGGPSTYGLSGIDIALWDIAGKVADLPLHRLLGGAGRRHLRAYASLLRYGDAAVAARVAAEAVSRGYLHVKLHEITVPPVASARQAVGSDVALMLDTNCPWSLGEARRMARELAPHNPLLARGTDLAARGYRRARCTSPQYPHGDRRGRKRRQRHAFRSDACCRGNRLCATERH